MRKEWNTVEVLRHSRHDWLNKIQLIKGNLDLNKIDRVRMIIDEIIIEAQQEAKLSNLAMPKFSELLLTSNWSSKPFILEYEVMETFAGCPLLDECVFSWTENFFHMLSDALDPFWENSLHILISSSEENIRFSFDLQGRIMNEDSLRFFLLETPSEKCTVSVIVMNEQELYFHIGVNCNELRK
ncbi:sporulation protein [Bacillus sp. M6-12]|uniref:Spo0B C-terminal domain-containing protein n=1 Tax=Bacillus sp. M6-12 TaxID=2054166 RepID=UPI000C779FA6|nr:Spo0B C-terminal domain-containing protein [Bacillus sp. M6-12]PLS15643.1 sporulation protein [Bacillus sp. M6-12]